MPIGPRGIHESSIKLPDYCTVFQAELIAIRETCKYLTTTTNTSNKHIIIWTDSLSSIEAISTLTIKSRTTKDCYDALNTLGNHNTLEVRWIAAHSDLWGNEKADDLAKKGTTGDYRLECPIPQSYIKRLINEKVTRLNNEEWRLNGPKHTKMLLGNKDSKIVHDLNSTLKNKRRKYRIAVQLITGHCGLNKHLHNMRKSDTSGCPSCGEEEETVAHFLGQCPAIAQLRGQYFQDYYLSVNDIFDRIHISTIITFVNHTRRLSKPEDLDNSGVT